MQARGESLSINPVPEEEGADNSAVQAVAAVRGAAVQRSAQEEEEEEVQRLVKRMEEAAAVGSQGLGFGLGLEEYYRGTPAQPPSAGGDGQAPQP